MFSGIVPDQGAEVLFQFSRWAYRYVVISLNPKLKNIRRWLTVSTLSVISFRRKKKKNCHMYFICHPFWNILFLLSLCNFLIIFPQSFQNRAFNICFIISAVINSIPPPEYSISCLFSSVSLTNTKDSFCSSENRLSWHQICQHTSRRLPSSS